jgi:hypothetical protein
LGKIQGNGSEAADTQPEGAGQGKVNEGNRQAQANPQTGALYHSDGTGHRSRTLFAQIEQQWEAGIQEGSPDDDEEQVKDE